MAKGSETGGCLNCYAARLNARGLPGLLSPTTSKPFARILQSGPRWTGDVELIESQLLLPLKWKKPRKIFVNSMSDLFHEALTDEAIDRVFAVMALCPQHVFQCLTKRPERMLQYINGRQWGRMCDIARQIPGGSHSHNPKYPLENVWMGVSVENQATADARIPLLLQTPAAVHWISLEPQLERVGLARYLRPVDGSGPKFLGWVVQGGESGPGARPFDIQWARNTIDQCREADVACFVKQLGAKPYWPLVNGLGQWADHVRFSRDTSREAPYHWDEIHLNDRKGSDPAEWPEDLRVQQFPLEPGAEE